MNDRNPSTSPGSSPSLENASAGGPPPPAGLTRADLTQGGPESGREPPSTSASEGQGGPSDRLPGTGAEPPLAWAIDPGVTSGSLSGRLVMGALDGAPGPGQGAPSSSPIGLQVPPSSESPGGAAGRLPPPGAELLDFDAEVRQHVAHAREHGWIDVGTQGREVRFAIPVKLTPRTLR